MAAAFCKSCKRGANTNTCRHCGGAMLSSGWPHAELLPGRPLWELNLPEIEASLRAHVARGQAAGTIPKYQTIDSVRRRVNGKCV